MHRFSDALNLNPVDPQPLGFVLLGVLYIAMVIAVRWQMIARPIRNNIDARLALLKAEVKRIRDEKKCPDVICAQVEEIVGAAEKENGSHGLLEVLFWSRGDETAVWQLADKAESVLADTWSESKLRIRLASDKAELRQSNDAVAVDMAARIDQALAQDPPATGAELCELRREAVRVEREALRQDDTELDYFNNKVLWLISISLLAILFVGVVAPKVAGDFVDFAKVPGFVRDVQPGVDPYERQLRHAVILFLIAGSVGGILSRLERAMGTGASSRWETMFLSPLVGSLAGCAGCLILLAGHSLGVLVPQLDADKLKLLLVSFAILFGFSERFFTGVAEKVVGNVLGSEQQPAVDSLIANQRAAVADSLIANQRATIDASKDKILDAIKSIKGGAADGPPAPGPTVAGSTASIPVAPSAPSPRPAQTPPAERAH